MRAAHQKLIRLDVYLMIRSVILISLSGTYMTSSPPVPTAQRIVCESIIASMFKKLCVVENCGVDSISKSTILSYKSIMI